MVIFITVCRKIRFYLMVMFEICYQKGFPWLEMPLLILNLHLNFMEIFIATSIIFNFKNHGVKIENYAGCHKNFNQIQLIAFVDTVGRALFQKYG